jgi:hypothetical protein
MPWQEQIATGLNFPAILAELPLSIVEGIPDSGASHELASHVVTALCIPVLWYAVGRRIDQLVFPNRRPQSLLSKVAFVTAFAVSIMLAAMDLVSIFIGPNDYLILKFFALAWLLAGIKVAHGGVRPRARA